jgi:hypothetical protein
MHVRQATRWRRGYRQAALVTEHSQALSGRILEHQSHILLYTVMTPGATRLDLWVLPLKGDRKPFPFVRREFDQLQGQFSPDGRRVAGTANGFFWPCLPAAHAVAVHGRLQLAGGCESIVPLTVSFSGPEPLRSRTNSPLS